MKQYPHKQRDYSLFLVVGTNILLFTLLFGLVYSIKSTKCEYKSQSFEAYKFQMFGGCLVKHDGKWIPLENIRVFGDVSKDGKND